MGDAERQNGDADDARENMNKLPDNVLRIIDATTDPNSSIDAEAMKRILTRENRDLRRGRGLATMFDPIETRGGHLAPPKPTDPPPKDLYDEERNSAATQEIRNMTEKKREKVEIF